MCKIGVIDIGSNSVRLMIRNNGETIYKLVNTTRLGEGLIQTGKLQQVAIARTVLAVKKFIEHCKIVESVNPYVFATEAVRASENGYEIVDRIKEETGIAVEVLSGQEEAKIGYVGATQSYKDSVNAIVDIGGGSTEIIVGQGDSIFYAKSLPIGAVRIKDSCGENKELILKYIDEVIGGYGEIPKFDNAIGIGGTLTSLAFATLPEEEYDANLVHLMPLTYEQVGELEEKLYKMDVEQRIALGIHEKRVDIICGACSLLKAIMKFLNIEKIIVSEQDNLEGFCFVNNLAR